MFLDSLGLFSDAQAVSSSAASTNSIDFGVDGNLGIGEPMCVVCTLDAAADFTTGDETYSVALQSDSDSAFGTAVNVISKPIVGGAAAGSKIVIPVPADNSMNRYARLYFTLAGTTPSVTVTAFLQPLSMVQNDGVYADGFTVS